MEFEESEEIFDLKETKLMIECKNFERHSDIELMKRLIKENEADLNAQNDNGQTALMIACERGLSDIVLLLLGQIGCDINVVDCNGSDALMHFCYQNMDDPKNFEIVYLFLHHPGQFYDLNRRNNFGTSALMILCEQSDADSNYNVIEMFIKDMICDVNLVDLNGYSALMHLISTNNIGLNYKTINLFIQTRWIDYSLRNVSGQSCLYLLCYFQKNPRDKQEKLIYLFLENNVPVDKELVYFSFDDIIRKHIKTELVKKFYVARKKIMRENVVVEIH